MTFFRDNPREIDPTHTLRRVAWPSLAIHFAILAVFLLALLQITVAPGVTRWSVGIIYAGYDTLLILFTFWQILRSRGASPSERSVPAPVTATLVIACFNEAHVIGPNLSALLVHASTADRIIIADDGSSDDLGSVLQSFGLRTPALNGQSSHANLSWLRLPHAGKSNVLNHALTICSTDLFITVDADTLLDDSALAALRLAFACDPQLVAATGILRPVCPSDAQGLFFQFFQRYEYMRNFLSRRAWGRLGTLMLLSGAFTGYRTSAIREVEGFATTSIVEDYELTHRLLAHSFERRLNWRTGIVGDAVATTIAPGTFNSFLRQRQRWFGGFLETHKTYRFMVGNSAYGRIGTVMLPVKAIDAFQPLFGMTGFVLLVSYIVTLNSVILKPIVVIVGAKLMIDLVAVTAFLFIYNRWVGGRLSRHLFCAWFATLLEPFVFQPIRHASAILGWIGFIVGRTRRRSVAL